jgi:hypothetical protein
VQSFKLGAQDPKWVQSFLKLQPYILLPHFRALNFPDLNFRDLKLDRQITDGIA